METSSEGVEGLILDSAVAVVDVGDGVEDLVAEAVAEPGVVLREAV